MMRRLTKVLMGMVIVTASTANAVVIETAEGDLTRSRLVEKVRSRRLVGHLQEFKDKGYAIQSGAESKRIVELGNRVYVFHPGAAKPKSDFAGAEKTIPVHYFPSLIQATPIIVMPDPEKTYPIRQELALDASESFSADGSALSYQWALYEPRSSTTFAQPAMPEGDDRLKQPVLRFAPDKVGIYAGQITVRSTDGKSASKSFSLMVGGEASLRWTLNNNVFLDSEAGTITGFPYVVQNDLDTPVRLGHRLGWKNETGTTAYGSRYYWRPVNLEVFGLVFMPPFSDWPVLESNADPSEAILRNPEWGGYYFFTDSSASGVQLPTSMYPLEVMGNPTPTGPAPIDSSKADQRSWGLAAVRAEEAWRLTKGTRAVKIAVIDTGINYLHKDLSPALHWTADGEFVGRNAIDASVRPFDNNGHGSHCAGIIAGAEANGGVLGVAPQVSVLPYKALDGHGGGTTLGLARAIYQAVNDGADIISASWGGNAVGIPEEELNLLRDAILYADSRKVTFVVAAGNGGSLVDGLPNGSVPMPVWFRTPNMISVAATAIGDDLASFSNYGPLVDVAAPGHRIVSDINQNSKGIETATFSGTSMATPLVAGIVGLMKSVNGNLSPQEIRRILVETSRPTDSLRNKVQSNGIVDAQAAVEKALELAASR